ncbi:MAG: hypothetical protein ACO3GW_06050 [Vulcanococcus sp.]
MTSKFRELIPHALVMAIDAIWGWTLSTFGQPLLIELLDRRHWKAVEVFDGLILPRLWVSYVVVLSAQLVWVMLVSPRELQSRRLRQLWWLGCGISLASALTVQVQLNLPGSAAILLLAAQLMDVSLLYWLSTTLLTPSAKRVGVIPGCR